MCTVHFGICVHSCEQVSGINVEERNLSSLSFFHSILPFSVPFFPCCSIFFLCLSFSTCLSIAFTSNEEKEFEILSHTHINEQTTFVALLPIYLLSTVRRPMKFQNRRVKRAERTTATTQ